jgi:exosome complex exonuclease RRP6
MTLTPTRTMEALSDFNTLQQQIQASLVAVTRSSQAISSEDLGFHRSLDPSLGRALDKQNARLLGLAERLLGNAASSTELVRPKLPDTDAVDAQWSSVVDVIDSLLEKADISLDEYTGAVKRLSPTGDQVRHTPQHATRTFTDLSQAQTPTKSQKYSRISQALRTQDIPKPQQTFDHIPTNAESGPFKPLLQSKPHAILPYAKALELFKDHNNVQHHPHPYQKEIEQYKYPTFVYTQAEPIPYHPYETTTATCVDTEEKVDEMLQELKKAKEIAIDLEHHDSRSYIGIVSLMQISTRDRDWIVDTLQPWRRKLSKLNEVFADPKILKVLHGAFMDITWLQRDLGLYVVGLFDTHFASRALGYTGGSLAFLLKKFVNFDAQKQYQTADWRIRPLPQEMFEYARSDTHFLLYIYDNMRNELIEKSDFSAPNHEQDKVHDVLTRSKDTALQRYEHPVYDAAQGLGPGGWYKMLSRTPALLDNQQFAVFRAIHQWRDQVAREQDDSTHYVMPNHNIFSIAKEMPTEKAQLFTVAGNVSQTVRLRADELVSVIVKAKEQGENGPDMVTTLKEIESHTMGIPLNETPSHFAALKRSLPKQAPVVAPVETKAPVLSRTDSSEPSGVRAKVSQFWGGLFGGKSQSEQPRPYSSNISLSVPLPPLTAEVFTSSAPLTAPPTPVAATPTSATPSSALPTPKDRIFTLKERGRKRDSDAMSTGRDSLATNADEIDITADESLEAKREAKRQRKEQKKAEKEAAAQHAAEIDLEEEEFDYAAAPSVLDASIPDPRDRRKNKKEPKTKAFNPFVKALDTMKGMPRQQKERAGKSMTFRK